MAITTFQSTPPNDYRGLEDYVSEEQKPFVLELIRRLQQNQSKLLSDLANQVIVDTSLLPTVTSGEAQAVDYSAASSTDVDDAEIVSMMWGGI